MKLICLLPCSEIDWNATGAMIGGITGIIAMFVSIIIAFRQGKTNELLGKQQKILTNNRIKIEIFEQRFRIYELFCNFYIFSDNWIFNKQNENEINNGLNSLSKKMGYVKESVENGTEDMFNNIQKGYEIQEIIHKEKFIFENRQIDIIINYINLFTTQLYYFCNCGSYTSEFNFLKSIHREINKLKIKELMENELTLENSYLK